MNRGPFIHGMTRYTYANSKNNRRWRPVSLRRKIINLIAFLLGLTIVIVTFALGGGKIFVAGALFFFGICSIPFTMSLGKDLVMSEYEKTSNQKRANLPLDFKRKKTIWGYILMFAPLYILMQACFFFPAPKAWIVPYIPTFVYTIVAAILATHTVSSFGFSVKKYKWIHILLYIGIFSFGLLVRIFII